MYGGVSAIMKSCNFFHRTHDTWNPTYRVLRCSLIWMEVFHQKNVLLEIKFTSVPIL